MLKRKLKVCKTCGEEKYIFSNGNCEKCATLIKSSKLNKSLKKSPPKKKLPTIAKLKKDARYWFQRWIRLRDLGKSCIYGSGIILKDIRAYDACHYLKFELFPQAGFDENNVYGGTKGENIRDCSPAYRRELIKRFGEQFVNELEDKYLNNRNNTFKWDREFLEGIIDKYKTLCKQIEGESKENK